MWRLLSFPFWLLAEPLSRDFALEIVKMLGIAFTAVGLLFNVWKGLEDRKLTQEKLVTERFSKAVEQLGKEKNPTVRIGGIYALERIARTYHNDFWMIMEVLTSYVRENASLSLELKQYPKNKREREDRQKKLKGLEEVSIDIQAVLTVIGRRKEPKFDRGENIDLSFTNLKGSSFRKANLQKANLSWVNLQEAILWEANLQDAILWGANLQDADLFDADFQGANLSQANLQRAFLWEVKLQKANLSWVNLQDADLYKANLQGADLRKANLQEAKLEGANLQNTNLREAKLQNASLKWANLQGANLWKANLKNAILWKANLQDAYLGEANLQGARLEGASLQDADLRKANLQEAILIETKNLTAKQIKSACFWDRAIYVGELDEEEQTVVAIESYNTKFIKELREDTVSDPDEPIDCSHWEKEN